MGSAVRIRYPAPLSVVGSHTDRYRTGLERTEPALATEIPYAAVAQLVEHLIAIQKVAGSNPVSRSMWP